MKKWPATIMVGIIGVLIGYWYRGTKMVNVAIVPTMKIIGVIDGDTVVTENKERIRLRHVDAPELEFCGGVEAKSKLEELVVNKQVEVRDYIPDQQNRMMAMLYVEGKSVSAYMLSSGWVRYHSDKVAETEELIAIKDKVKNEKLGIFGEKCSQTENKLNPKCNIKGNIAPNNQSERIYQMPGCVQYKTTTVDLDRGEAWFCSEKEAVKAGYVKSKRCN